MIHIIDIIRGVETDKVKNKNHHKLPTFGKGTDHSKAFWEIFARQLISSGNINIDIEHFGALKITKSGKDILYGRKSFFYKEVISHLVLSKEQKTKKRTLEKQKPKKRTSEKQKPKDLSLFSDLKKLRLELARKKEVPAFIIFSDRTLIEMTNLKPQDLEALQQVDGVGKQKLQLYGRVFLKIIEKHSN